MKTWSRIAGMAVWAAIGTSAHGQLAGSANLTPQLLASGQYRYSAVLHNNGTTTIGTFWFSWLPPFYNLLPTSPVNIVSPPGWNAAITAGFGGFAVEWTAATPAAEVAPGASLTGFGFDSPDSPATLRGTAPSFPSASVAASYVYIGAPELDPGYRFNAVVGNVCYPNCDGSTTAPILNVADFTCFLNRFAAGDSYANCDGSTTPPVLNVADFTCFLNAFAAGCS